MNALVYLGGRLIKNMVREWLRKPGVVIFYAVILVILFSSLTFMPDSTLESAPAADYLPAAALIAFFMILYFALRSALTHGTTVFSLEDVQLLFPSPIKPQVILMYGVVRQCVASLTILFVIVCQTANLRNLFGMSTAAIVILVVGWFLATVVSQIIGLTLYALFAERPTAKRVALWITNGGAIAMVLAGGIALLREPTLQSVAGMFSHPAWGAFPVAGWMARAVTAAQAGELFAAILWILPTLALGGAVLLILWRANPDYYEDVLSLSQERFEMRQRVQTQGKTGAEGFSRRRVRLGKVGLTAGRGASAFFFKHMTEMRREGLWFIDQKTVLYALSIGIFVFSMRDAVDDVPFVLALVLVMMIFIQMIFTMTSGRFVQEMLRPFLYLVPAPARSKVFFGNLQPAIKAGLDALLCFSIAGVFLGFDLPIVLLASLIVAAMNLLFTGGTLLAEWILGENQSKMLSAFLYFLFEMILIAPGIVIFFIAMSAAGGYLAYALLAAYTALAAALLFLLLGGMLHNMETA